MYQLAAYRAVQGLGAGGLMSLALAIIGDIVPPRERAKYQGYFLAVFGTSSVARPGHRRVPRRAEPRSSASPAGAGSSSSTCRSASSPSSSSPGRSTWTTTVSTTASTGRVRPCCPSRSSRSSSSLEQGHTLGLGVGPTPSRLRHQHRRRHRLPLAGVADEGGGDLPARDVPHQDRRGRLDRLGRHRHRDVRRPRRPPALPPDRQGRDPDRGRTLLLPMVARHHDRVDQLGPAHRPDR